MKPFKSAIFALPLCIASQLSQATTISGPDQITFSHAIGVDTIVIGSYDALTDNILDGPGSSGAVNGVSLESYPLSLIFNFDRPYDLTNFFLLSEYGSNSIGAAKDFNLTFFDKPDGGGNQIGPTFHESQLDPTSLVGFDLNAGTYVNARSFSLKITDIHSESHPNAVPGRTELSEVQLAGSPSIPEPTSVSLLLMATASILHRRPRRN